MVVQGASTGKRGGAVLRSIAEDNAMATGPRKRSELDGKKLDALVAKAIKERDTRLAGYREQSLRLHPWICARCGREFTRENLHELTVHHKDHDHNNNPPDGSNWENLCLYCHDNEHQRFAHLVRGYDVNLGAEKKAPATHSPFAGLKDLIKDRSG
jgi:5-methylcytosine-specific restriction endonuclease McrA